MHQSIFSTPWFIALFAIRLVNEDWLWAATIATAILLVTIAGLRKAREWWSLR